VPGHAGDDQVERPPGKIAILELGDLDLKPVPAGEGRHSRVNLDAEHAKSGRPEGPCGNAGTDTDVKNLATGSPSHDPVHQGLRVPGPRSVIPLPVGTERLGYQPRSMGLALRRR
jgi:hypothetical protein